MTSALRTVVGLVAVLASITLAKATDLDSHLAELRRGGLVIVLRHFATDASQRDIVPFDFDDMRAQRQLSEQGREDARAIGAALARLGVPVGAVFTSRLNRAVETGRLLAPGAPLTPVDELTDSSAGNAALMAGATGGGSETLGRALQMLANTSPATATNTSIVTHKTNVIDAFGPAFSSIDEGEALIYRPVPGGQPHFVARIPARGWLEQTVGAVR